MAATAALQRIDKSRRNVRRLFRISFTGSYANSGTTGDVVDMTLATNPNNLERALLSEIPGSNRFILTHVNLPGYVVMMSIGTALASLLGIRIFQSDDAVDPLDEIANGVYAAAITAGYVDVMIESRW